MRKKILCIFLAVSCLVAGCASGENQEIKNKTQDTEYKLEVKSSIKPEDCYICGEHSDSLMLYYAKKDSIGIIHWNSGSICDAEVRVYDDDGNELFGQNDSMKTSSFGKGFGNVMISATPTRGISEVKVYYEDTDEVNFTALEKKLCQECLDQVAEFYADQKNYGEDSRISTTGYCLVDFKTKQLYTLSDLYRGYFIRDYYIKYDIVEDAEGTEDRIEVLLVYTPERES